LKTFLEISPLSLVGKGFFHIFAKQKGIKAPLWSNNPQRRSPLNLIGIYNKRLLLFGIALTNLPNSSNTKPKEQLASVCALGMGVFIWFGGLW